MVRLWSTLVVLVMVCFVAVSVVSAQQKKGRSNRPDPAARWAAIAKAADKEGATELSKEDFIKGVKGVGGRMADQGEAIFNRVKKADEKKVTKDEFIAFAKQPRGKRSEKKPESK